MRRILDLIWTHLIVNLFEVDSDEILFVFGNLQCLWNKDIV